MTEDDVKVFEELWTSKKSEHFLVVHTSATEDAYSIFQVFEGETCVVLIENGPVFREVAKRMLQAGATVYSSLREARQMLFIQ